MLVFEGFFVGVMRKSGVLTRFDLSSWLDISCWFCRRFVAC